MKTKFEVLGSNCAPAKLDHSEKCFLGLKTSADRRVQDSGIILCVSYIGNILTQYMNEDTNIIANVCLYCVGGVCYNENLGDS